MTAHTLVFFVILSIASWNCHAFGSEEPHIVFILADDLGWDDVSFHGSNQIPTPNLDALAADGILLNSYYVQPICTPSRSALMTGRHPIHTGLQHNTITSSSPYGLGLNETLLPQYLNTLGYRSHMVGKWHLGFFAKEYTPTFRGFHSHYGYYQGCEDYWTHTVLMGPKYDAWGLDFWNDTEVVRTAFGQYSTELFTAEAERIINSHDKSKPLFLYLPYQAVHSGDPGAPDSEKLQAPWKYVSKLGHIQSDLRRTFAGMVSALDDAVGNVTRTLHANGMLNNTIIVFSTDNGGPADRFDYNDACNWPLRGGKRTMWEGGVRGNGFIWSPLLQHTNYVSEHMIQIIDWLPTLLEAAGYDISKLPANVDGVSQWKALSENTASPRTEMLHNIDPVIGGDGALRQGHMKVVYGGENTREHRGWYPPEMLLGDVSGPESDNVTEVKYPLQKFPASILASAPEHLFHTDLWDILSELGRNPARNTKPVEVQCGPIPPDVTTNCKPWIHPCLFNITADPCEYTNLADKHPDMVHKLMARIQEYNATAVPPLNKPADPAGYPVHFGGVWRPWVNL